MSQPNEANEVDITIGDDQYRVTDIILGKGAFGEVRIGYRKNGENKEIDTKKYAIKIVKGDDPTLDREIHMLNAIKDRCDKDFLCYYGDAKQDGKHYIVMEYVDGVPFNSESGATYPLTLDIMKDCIQALSTLHSMGIIHRDIKPENMMIVDVGGKKKVKYLDWGLSCINTNSDDCTGRAGTIMYMDPVLVLGGEATPFSDIYSLGVVFYELFVYEKLVITNPLYMESEWLNGKWHDKPYTYREDGIDYYDTDYTRHLYHQYLHNMTQKISEISQREPEKEKELYLMLDIISLMIIPPFDPRYKKITADDLLENIKSLETETYQFGGIRIKKVKRSKNRRSKNRRSKSKKNRSKNSKQKAKKSCH